MQNRNSMLNMDRYNCTQTGAMETNMTCNIAYPEIYYKLQPFVMLTCDQMEVCGNMMSQKMLDQAGEDIYTNVCMMHPDLEEYAGHQEMKLTVESAQQDWNRDRDGYRDRYRDNRGIFRRRGVFQDFVDVLLLNELLRRGTFFF